MYNFTAAIESWREFVDGDFAQCIKDEKAIDPARKTQYKKVRNAASKAYAELTNLQATVNIEYNKLDSKKRWEWILENKSIIEFVFDTFDNTSDSVIRITYNEQALLIHMNSGWSADPFVLELLNLLEIKYKD
jgi:hypothetical protein